MQWGGCFKAWAQGRGHPLYGILTIDLYSYGFLQHLFPTFARFTTGFYLSKPSRSRRTSDSYPWHTLYSADVWLLPLPL